MGDELKDGLKNNVPSTREIINLSFGKVLKKEMKTDYIKDNFSSLVESMEKTAHGTYLEKEREAWRKSVAAYVFKNLDEKAGKKEFANFLVSGFPDFYDCFMSIFQSRKARAGSTFEDIIKVLFKRLNYPFTEQAIINGKPDFLMPSKDYYDKNAPECIIFTAKRTIRERWRQIVTEGTRGLGFFLATIDADISKNQLKEMQSNRIYLVVPKGLKEKEAYNEAGNVISFEDFFDDYLDPAMKRWKKAGII